MVLTWGSKPSDLDAHLLCQLSDGISGHVSYGNKKFSVGNKCISKLDVDDINGYGPETVTIYNGETGDYTYYVHNYSNELEMQKGGMAIVRVYKGDNAFPSYTFSLPSQLGRVWNVFNYNSSTGRIEVINQVSNSVIRK